VYYKNRVLPFGGTRFLYVAISQAFAGQRNYNPISSMMRVMPA
jgi:hypothetical protein